MTDYELVQYAIDHGGALEKSEYRIDRPLVIRHGQHARLPVTLGTSVPSFRGPLFRMEGGTLRDCSLDAAGCVTAVQVVGDGVTIANCTLIGSIAPTLRLIEVDALSSQIDGLTVEGCFLSTTRVGVSLMGRATNATVERCEFSNWLDQAVFAKGFDEVPRGLTVDRCVFSRPYATGKGARQAVTVYSGQRKLIESVTVRDCTIIGRADFENKVIPYERGGMGDTVVLQFCDGFRIARNKIQYGGENGMAVIGSTRGIITDNPIEDCDAHGIHCGALTALNWHVMIRGNEISDCANRADGSPDVMSGIYLQNSRHVTLSENRIVDSRDKRRTKVGVLIGSSRWVYGESEYRVADQAGFIPVYAPNSSDVFVSLTNGGQP